MKRGLVWGGIFVLTLSCFAQGPVIEAVTVYPSGAMVTAVQTVDLKAGINTVNWGALGENIDSDSVRVDFPKQADLHLLDRTTRRVELADEASARRAELEAQLKAAQDQLQIKTDALAVASKNETFLDKIQDAVTSPEGDNKTLPSIAQWNDLQGFLKDGWQKSLSEQRACETDLKAARDEVSRIGREIANLRSTSSRSQLELVLTVQSPKAQKATISLAYFDPAATWSPQYEVWVNPADASIKLAYDAQLKQWSDSDWSDAAVRLATARPRAGMNPPELTPWWVRAVEPQPIVANAMMMKSARGVYGAAAPAMAEMSIAADSAGAFAPVAIEQGLTNAEFVIPWKATVKNDNTPSKVTIADIPLSAELVYKVVPELSDEAYLVGKVKNTSEFPLLPGSSQLYVDGSFVGKARLDLIEPNESFDLSLGVDPSVKVERKLLAKKTDLTGLMEDNKKVTYRYEITLTNNKAMAVALELKERIALSQHEKIKVELLEPKELAKDVDKEGFLTWKLPLKAGEKRVVNLSYSIEYPKKMDVAGLQ